MEKSAFINEDKNKNIQQNASNNSLVKNPPRKGIFNIIIL